MSAVMIIIGIVLAALFLLKMKQGAEYNEIVDPLDKNVFPLHELYGVGFAWAAMKPFQLDEKHATDLEAQATLLYDAKYAEYYANVAWAELLTMVHFMLTLTFLLTGILSGSGALIFLMGAFMTVLLAVNSLQGMKNKLDERTDECTNELPNVVSTLAILINSGMVLRDAWNLIAASNEGAFYELMRKASENMKNGYSDADAILQFSRETNSDTVKKFTSALLESMEKGGAELSEFLTRQSSELWDVKRQRMLQAGEKASTKLLGPTVVMFVGILIIIISAAFAGSLF